MAATSREDAALPIAAKAIPQESTFISLAQNFVAELLSEIFILLLPENNTPRLCRDQCPLNVSHVCRTWRNTALSTRKLWAGLHILCKDDNYILDASMAMQQWIARSGMVKAALRIECPRPGAIGIAISRTNSSWLSIETLLTGTLEFSERLARLSFVLGNNYAEISTELSKFTNDHFHSLESLELHITKEYDYQDIDCIGFKDTFSRLTELKLSFTSGVGRFRIGWVGEFPVCPHLRKLTLHLHASTKQIISVLGNLPTVEEVELHLNLYPFGSQDNVLSTIRIFPTIRMCSISGTSHILGSSTMPSLQELTVDGIDCTELVLEAFISRSRPPLESLLINGSPGAPNVMLHYLHTLPLLRCLRICMTEAIARDLVLPTHTAENKASVCPLLEEIEIVLPRLEFQDAQVLWSVLEDMVRSRRPVTRTRKAAGTSIPTKATECQTSKLLRQISIPSADIKRHPLYKGLKDVIREGFILRKSVEQ